MGGRGSGNGGSNRWMVVLPTADVWETRFERGAGPCAEMAGVRFTLCEMMRQGERIVVLVLKGISESRGSKPAAQAC